MAERLPPLPPEAGTALQALERGDHREAVRGLFRLLSQPGPPAPGLVQAFCMARTGHRADRQGRPVELAVSGWEMSNNAAGRVRALAELHAGGDPGAGAAVSIIGTLLDERGGRLWPPVDDDAFPLHLARVAVPADFLPAVIDLVLAQPRDLVHLSKPRMPNIVIGLLYRMVWGARVLIDVDDEELAFTGAETPLTLDEQLALRRGRPGPHGLYSAAWTRVAVGLTGLFDAVTVSNPALQARYGGLIVPHARPVARFSPRPGQQAAARARHGIAPGDFVVLFLGTPRAHKGLPETARALAELGRPGTCLVIAGDFPDPELKRQIAEIPGLRVHFLPDQPYGQLAETVALGDACVLLQDADSLVGRFQFPAKLVDALAMGLVALVTPTPALADVVAGGAAVAVTPDGLAGSLARFIDDPEARRAQAARGRAWFLAHLSDEACRPPLAALVHHPPMPPAEQLLEGPHDTLVLKGINSFPGREYRQTPKMVTTTPHRPNSDLY